MLRLLIQLTTILENQIIFVCISLPNAESVLMDHIVLQNYFNCEHKKGLLVYIWNGYLEIIKDMQLCLILILLPHDTKE